MTELEKQLFDKAVEEYSDMVTGLCLVRLGNRQDAEDCYQNVFLKLYRNMAMLLKEPEHLKAWLITVTVNARTPAVFVYVTKPSRLRR